MMKKIMIYTALIALAACNNNSDTNKKGNDPMISETVMDEQPSAASSGSGCSSYYWFKEGAIAEYVIKDATGAEKSRTKSTVKNLRNENGVLMADFVATTAKGTNITATYKCEGDKIYMDMKSFFSNNFGGLAAKGGMEMEVENAYLSFPAEMKVGDELEEAHFKVIAKKDGKAIMTTTNNITGRKVEAVENISTPAGSWDCLKITETTIVTSEMMGRELPAKETKTVYWFAPGVGVIRNNTYDKDGSLKDETELVSLTMK